MYQNSIKELPRLQQDRYENIFQIYQDKDDKYYYNLLETIVFPENLPDGIFGEYNVTPGDTLPFISHKLFGTINLWWVVALVNKINNPTETLEPGTLLKVPSVDIIREILVQINT